MLIYIAVVSTINLCVGYLLGAWIGVLPGLPERKPVEPPVPPLELGPEPPKKKPAPRPQAKVRPKPSPEQVMEGMAAFQAQLAQMGAELQANVDDETAFGECAGRLQQANHDYLEQTQATIDELDAAPKTKESTDCRNLLSENARQVGEKSEEIDSMIDDGLASGEAREKLIGATDELEKLVEAAEHAIETKASEPEEPIEEIADKSTDKSAEEPPAEPVDDGPVDEAAVDEVESEEAAAEDDVTDAGESAEAALDAAVDAIQKALDNDVEELVVATLRRDLADLPEADDPREFESRLLSAVAELAQEFLTDGQEVETQPDGRLTLVLAGDDPETATQRVDRIRRQLEKTTFLSGDAKVQSTYTCASAENAGGFTREQLVANMEEALGESSEHGENRCYHHDGSFTAPVVTEEGAKAAVVRTVKF